MFQFQHGEHTFMERTGAPSPVSVTVNMMRPVRTGTTPAVLLTGFRYSFTRRAGDHPIGRVEITLEVEGFTGNAVTVRALLGVRDWSGEFDDAYEGMVRFVVVADLAD